MSGILARCRGWWPPPPLSILALEPNLAPKSCFPTRWHQFQLIWHLFRIFFPKITKKWWKLKTYRKLLKMNWNSNFCNFWDISTCNTSKESIFYIEFKFKQKNRICLKKNRKKNQIFSIFCQNQCWPLVFNCTFLKIVPKNLKTKVTPAFERFWNQKSPKESSLSLSSKKWQIKN